MSSANLLPSRTGNHHMAGFYGLEVARLGVRGQAVLDIRSEIVYERPYGARTLPSTLRPSCAATKKVQVKKRPSRRGDGGQPGRPPGRTSRRLVL